MSAVRAFALFGLLAIAHGASHEDLVREKFASVAKSLHLIHRIEHAAKQVERANATAVEAADVRGRSLAELSYCTFFAKAMVCAKKETNSYCTASSDCEWEEMECDAKLDVSDGFALLTDPMYVSQMEMMETCDLKSSAASCNADKRCEYDSGCGLKVIYLVIWIGNQCPSAAAEIASALKAEGVTMEDVAIETKDAGIEVSPDFKVALEKELPATSAASRASVAMFVVTVVAALAMM